MVINRWKIATRVIRKRMPDFDRQWQEESLPLHTFFRLLEFAYDSVARLLHLHVIIRHSLEHSTRDELGKGSAESLSLAENGRSHCNNYCASLGDRSREDGGIQDRFK